MFEDWENETTGLINLAVVYLLVSVIYRFIVKVTIVVYKLKRYHTYLHITARYDQSREKNVDYFT